jgi:Domain of unknown function (DUF1844)
MSEHEHSVPADGPSAPTPAEQMDLLREQLAAVSAADFVTELAAHLLNMATIRLGLPPERHGEFTDLDQARLLIDALAGLLEGAAGHLGQAEAQLRDALAQLRLAWVELAGRGAPEAAPGGEEGTEEGGDDAARLARPPSGLWVPGMD